VQNLEEKERKLHQTRSNFRTGNSDLDGKHLPERCSNSVPPGRTDNYRNAVPAPKCLPFWHHYTTALGPEKLYRLKKWYCFACVGMLNRIQFHFGFNWPSISRW